LIITIYNFKGGVGKTSIALNFALTAEYGIITNDVYSPLESVLSEKQYIKVEPDEDFPDIPKKLNIIYDLGGHIDKRAIKIIKKSDYILIPTLSDFLSLKVTINAILEIEIYNNKIIIIGNGTHKSEIKHIKKVIRDCKFNYPLFELKKSKAFINIFREQKSIGKMTKEGGLKAYHYKVINEQFDKLIKYIEE